MFRTRALTSATLLLSVFLTACDTPRGAPIQQEVLSADQQTDGFSVHYVNRDFLSTVANWPTTGSHSSSTKAWIPHQHNGSGRRISSGDRIDLSIWESEQNSLLTAQDQKVVQILNLRVSEDGSIFVPYTGKVFIAGKSEDEARQEVQVQLETISPKVQVQLTPSSGPSQSVSLVGGVNSPGSFPLDDAHFSLLNLISLGGGASNRLKNPQVKLLRNGKSYAISLQKLYDQPNLDTILKGGDKVIIEDDRRFFRSLGAVASEKIVAFDRDEITAIDAMSMVRGLSDARADPKGVMILREYAPNQINTNIGPMHERTIFVFDLTSADGLFSAGNFLVNSEDTILVTESPLVGTGTVLDLISEALRIRNRI